MSYLKDSFVGKSSFSYEGVFEHKENFIHKDKLVLTVFAAMPSSESQFDNEVFLEEILKEPRQFKVLMHNDNYTTMEFVINILREVFLKNQDEAVQITRFIHEQGAGVCGVYTAELAETKVDIVHKKAQQAGFPLRCSLEAV